jgi:hypothetical protein
MRFARLLFASLIVAAVIVAIAEAAALPSLAASTTSLPVVSTTSLLPATTITPSPTDGVSAALIGSLWVSDYGTCMFTFVLSLAVATTMAIRSV